VRSIANLLKCALTCVLAAASCSREETQASAPKSPVADVVPTEAGWSLGMLGSGTRLTIVVPEEGKGSRGMAFRFKADPRAMLALRVEARTNSGAWTLRIGSGDETPNWLPLNQTGRTVRMTGASDYEVLVYSDSPGAQIELMGVALSPAGHIDSEFPLAWPLQGPEVDREIERTKLDWGRLFGVEAERSALAAAKAVARFVHEHSRVAVVTVAGSGFTTLGSPHFWNSNPHQTIDGSCGTFADAAMDGFGRLGLTARAVSLGSRRFYDGEALVDTHVLVEIFDPELSRWILLDPTFNVCFRSDTGEELGITQLMEYQRTARPWRAVPLGPVLPGRSLAEYYLPFGDLLFMAQAPAVPKLGALGARIQSADLSMSEVLARKYPSAR
jgi:hypothetical protein